MKLKIPASLRRNPKTTLIGVIGAAAVLAGRFGFQLSIDEQLAIVLLMVFALSFFTGDAE